MNDTDLGSLNVSLSDTEPLNNPTVNNVSSDATRNGLEISPSSSNNVEGLLPSSVSFNNNNLSGVRSKSAQNQVCNESNNVKKSNDLTNNGKTTKNVTKYKLVNNNNETTLKEKNSSDLGKGIERKRIKKNTSEKRANGFSTENKAKVDSGLTKKIPVVKLGSVSKNNNEQQRCGGEPSFGLVSEGNVFGIKASSSTLHSMREVPVISVQTLDEDVLEDYNMLEGGPPSSVSTYINEEDEEYDEDDEEDMIMSSSPRPSPASLRDLYDWHDEVEENLL